MPAGRRGTARGTSRHCTRVSDVDPATPTDLGSDPALLLIGVAPPLRMPNPEDEDRIMCMGCATAELGEDNAMNTTEAVVAAIACEAFGGSVTPDDVDDGWLDE